MPKVEFSIVEETATQVFIADSNKGGISVTNAAEQVVLFLLLDPARRQKSFIYKDTEGRWDRLMHNGREFIGFAPYSGWHPLYTALYTNPFSLAA